MTAFLWSMVVMLTLSTLNHGYNIITRNTERNLMATVVDLVITVCLLGWAVRLLP